MIKEPTLSVQSNHTTIPKILEEIRNRPSSLAKDQISTTQHNDGDADDNQSGSDVDILEGNMESLSISEKKRKPIVSVMKHAPPTAEDFVRNFLVQRAMEKTFSCFQAEWYGKVDKTQSEPLQDVYQQNKALEDEMEILKHELKELKQTVSKTRQLNEKLRKERDQNKLNSLRMSQEKTRLNETIKKLKKASEDQQPIIKQLQQKIDVILKEKAMVLLDKEKLSYRLDSLEEALKSQNKKEVPPKSPTRIARVNPYLSQPLPESKTTGFSQKFGFQAHSEAVSSLKFHPKKLLLATSSDDQTWKLWSFPEGELVTSSTQYGDWLSDIDFHPDGNIFATSSGDCTVALWRINTPNPIRILRDHSLPVWSCIFHDYENTLASCSLDCSVRLWDVETGACKTTLRGHADSVNYGQFFPYSSNFLSCSGDKTLSLWDTRAGICSMSLYGHSSAVNHLAISLKGNTIVSCDANGDLIFWDVRKVDELHRVHYGPKPLNKVTVDPSGNVVFATSDDGSCKIFSTPDQKVHAAIQGQTATDSPSLQAVALDRNANYLVTADELGVVKFFA